MKRTFLVVLFLCSCPLAFAGFFDLRSSSFTSFSSAPSQIFVPLSGDFKNQYIIGRVGSEIQLVDTATWDLADVQPEQFADSINGFILLSDQKTILVTLASGDLAKIKLDDLKNQNQDVKDNTDDPRLIALADQTDSGPLGDLVLSRTSNKVYFVNTSDNFLYFFDTSTEDLQSITLTTAPHHLIQASRASEDKLYITSTKGTLFSYSPSLGLESHFVPVGVDDKASPELGAMAMDPNGDYLYIIDETNTAIWVYDTVTDTFVDQQSGGTTDPIRFEKEDNTGLKTISLIESSDQKTVHGFVGGDLGLSIIDASAPEATPSAPKIIDQDTSTTNIFEALDLGAIPGVSVASDDDYTFIVGGDSKIYVLSDKPFVTIDTSNAISLKGNAATFDLSFTADEAGSYRVVAGSDITGSGGTELLTDENILASQVNKTITTPTIDISQFDSSVFVEGKNRVFIFVKDSSGNIGRDAIDITLDRPPSALDKITTQFGNEHAFVFIKALADTDIAKYEIAVQVASSATANCTKEFDTANAKAQTSVASSGCQTECTIEVSPLTNGESYCIAVRAIDNTDQKGDWTIASEAVTPEKTVGPATFFGEGGCALRQKDKVNSSIFYLIVFSIFLSSFLKYLMCHCERKRSNLVYRDGLLRRFAPRNDTVKRHRNILVLFFFVLFFASTSFAQDDTSISSTPKIIPPPKIGMAYEFSTDLFFFNSKKLTDFTTSCCHVYPAFKGGFHYDRYFYFLAGGGFERVSGVAVGESSGKKSGDRFKLWMIPMSAEMRLVLDLNNKQLFIPWIGGGVAGTSFSETSDGGESIKGIKWGVQGSGGFLIRISHWDEIGDNWRDIHVRDILLNASITYRVLNSFKSSGLDLSQWGPGLGLTFLF